VCIIRFLVDFHGISDIVEALLQANGIAPLNKGCEQVAASEDLEMEDAGNESDNVRIKKLEVKVPVQGHVFRR
jgi:hypothetical protein